MPAAPFPTAPVGPWPCRRGVCFAPHCGDGCGYPQYLEAATLAARCCDPIMLERFEGPTPDLVPPGYFGLLMILTLTSATDRHAARTTLPEAPTV